MPWLSTSRATVCGEQCNRADKSGPSEQRVQIAAVIGTGDATTSKSKTADRCKQTNDKQAGEKAVWLEKGDDVAGGRAECLRTLGTWL